MKLRVTKRDGKIEDFDIYKIDKVVKAAGLSDEEAKILCDAINKWISDYNKPMLTSLQIRDRVLVEIQKINKYAAKKFIWFEKYKDKNYGVKF